MAGADLLRTRQHRELFQRAVRENVSLDEARRRAAAERWAAADQRLSARKAPCRIETSDDDQGQPLKWFQR